MTVDRRARMLGVGVLVGAVLAAVFLFPASSAPPVAPASAPAPGPPDSTPSASAPQTPISESRFARAQRRRRRSPVTEGATKTAQERCLAQATNLLVLRGGPDGRRPLLEVTDIYGVGDPETGAGDSLIIDGTSRLTSTPPRVWHCALATLARDRVGSPMLAVLESWPTIPLTWQATYAVHEEARIRCLEAAVDAWPSPAIYPEPLMRRAGDTLVVTGPFPPSDDGLSREYRCDALRAPHGGVVVTVAEVPR